MIDKFFNALFIFVTLIAMPGERAFATEKEVDPTHALSDPNNLRYYGTALFFEVSNDRHALFLTNAHLLPDHKGISNIQISGPMSANVPTSIELVGLSWGHDLAVIQIKIPTSISDSSIQLALASAKSLMSPAKYSGPVRHYHFGIADSFQFRPGYFSLGREDWNETVSIITHQPAPGHSEDHLHTISDCPQPFITHCYLSDLPSWGFSGGAHFTVDQDTNGKRFRRIVGIVSNYQFLSEATTVIPIEIALFVAHRIISTGQDIRFDRQQNPNFELITPLRIRVLTGPMKGTELTQEAWSSPTGGGDLAGGGDAPNAFPHFKNNVQKGLWTLMHFHPGVRINKTRFQTAWLPSENRTIEITQLSDFVRAYIKDPWLALHQEALAFQLPSNLSTFGFGLRSELVPEVDTEPHHLRISNAIWDRAQKILIYVLERQGPAGPTQTPVVVRYETETAHALSSRTAEIQLNQVSCQEGENPAQSGQAFASVDIDPVLNRTLIRLFFSSDLKNGTHVVQNLTLRTR